MAELRLNIRTDGAAFGDPDDGDSPRPELARILRQWADRIENDIALSSARTIFDDYGNDVGRVKLYGDDDE